MNEAFDTAMIVYDEDPTKCCTREAWTYLIERMNSGDIIEIHETVYYYFLEVLPPKKTFNNGFEFAEGWEPVKIFTHEQGRYYCQLGTKIYFD